MSAKESNFTQELILPSKGLLNPEIPEGKVTQRCMMVKDQKFLSGSSRTTDSPINQILQNTVTAPESFDISNLSMPDTLYLLFKLRILSYGSEYTFKTRCPECGSVIDVTVDLSAIEVNTLEEDYLKDLSVVLPHRGDTVYTKILTNADIEDMNREIKRRKRKNPQDESEYILKIVYSIEKIKLKEDKSELTHPIDIERYIESLTDLDASAILAARDSVIFGIIPVVDTQCPECGSDIEVGIDFSGKFFRPSFPHRK